jgi:hypothetical protein
VVVSWQGGSLAELMPISGGTLDEATIAKVMKELCLVSRLETPRLACAPLSTPTDSACRNPPSLIPRVRAVYLPSLSGDRSV